MVEKQSCKAQDCAREAFAKGYCRKHYRLWRRGEMPKARYKICTEEKCRKPRFRGSLCEEHHHAARAKAAPAASVATAPVSATT